MKMGAKGVVIACNTATSAAVRVLRLMYPELPLVGIEPAVKPAAEKYPQGNIPAVFRCASGKAETIGLEATNQAKHHPETPPPAAQAGANVGLQ